MPAGLSTSSSPSVAVVLTGSARRSILELREQCFDARSASDTLVSLEYNFRRETESQRAANASAQMSGEAGESVACRGALRLGSVDADEYRCDAQIARHVDASDGDETHDPRILDVLTQKRRHFDANRLGDAVRSSVVAGHRQRKLVAVSTIRQAGFPSMKRSTAVSTDS